MISKSCAYICTCVTLYHYMRVFSRGKRNLVNFTLTLSMVMSQVLLILISMHEISRKQSKFGCYIRIRNVALPLNPSLFRDLSIQIVHV